MSTATMLVPMNGHGHDNAIQTARPVVGHLTVDHVKAAMENIMSIRTYVAEQLVDGKDYGIIPGTGRKDKHGNETGTKVLLKPGAEQIALLLDCRFQHEIERVEMGDGHMEVNVRSLLISRSTGNVVAEGFGMCSTMEGKYRFRAGKLACPKCGKETVNKSKDKPEFYCWAKVGGCGATFGEKDPSITGQVVGKVVNDNIYDSRNTVLKMAKKRADVDATLTAAALSGEFTQDLEEIHDIRATTPPPVQEAAPAQPRTASSPGTEFAAFLREESAKLTRDLNSWAVKFGQRRQYPAEINTWNLDHVTACWEAMQKALAKDADAKAAKVAPAATAEAQRDENKADFEQAVRTESPTKRLKAWLMEATVHGNKDWLKDERRIKAGIPDDEPLVEAMYQISGHLGKWAEKREYLGYVRPEPYKPGLVIEQLALVWDDCFDDLAGELRRYIETELPTQVIADAAKRAAKAKPEAQDEPGANG